MQSEKKYFEFNEEIIKNLGTIFAVLSAILYGVGYLVVASYLASKGISAQMLITPKYMLTGILMVSMLGFFYFYIWRKIPELISKTHHAINLKSRLSTSFFSLYFIVEIGYRICITALVVLTIFGKNELIPLFILLLIPFAIDVFFKRLDGYKKHLILCYLISLFFYALAIYIVISHGQKNKVLGELTIQFATLTILSLTIFYSGTWIKGLDRIYSISYLIIFLATIAISFGSGIYEEISPKFGGGAPIQVEVNLTPEASLDLSRQFSKSVNSIYLIVQTDDNSIFKIVKNDAEFSYIQIRNSLINSISSTAEVNSYKKSTEEKLKIRATLCELPYLCKISQKI